MKEKKAPITRLITLNQTQDTWLKEVSRVSGMPITEIIRRLIDEKMRPKGEEK